MSWPPAHPIARQEFDHIVDYLRDNVNRALAKLKFQPAIAGFSL